VAVGLDNDHLARVMVHTDVNHIRIVVAGVPERGWSCEGSNGERNPEHDEA
jgi:hypothetical protein